MAERFLVVVVPARHHQRICRRRERWDQVGQGSADVADDESGSARKPLLVGVEFSVVDHRNGEIGRGCQRRHRVADVAASDQQQGDPRRRGQPRDAVAHLGARAGRQRRQVGRDGFRRRPVGQAGRHCPPVIEEITVASRQRTTVGDDHGFRESAPLFGKGVQPPVVIGNVRGDPREQGMGGTITICPPQIRPSSQP